ncbi:hypothetical protein V2J09_008714 [Rumex salicifolius]
METPQAVDSSFDESDRNSSFASRSNRDVNYSCGSCGYDLSLSSSNRNTASIGSKYGKSIKRGMISFFQIDESRFTQADEIQCIPFFSSKKSWGLIRKKTKLLCRKCGNHIGNAYDDRTQSYALVPAGITDNKPVRPEVVSYRKFDIRIRALQPSSSVDQSGTPLFV